MKVCLLSAYPLGPLNFAVTWLRDGAQEDNTGVHELCDDPERADMVLFVEHHPRDDPFFLSVLRHPVMRRYREKAFLYHDGDDVIALMPGLYPSLEQSWYDPARTRPAHYLAKLRENKAIRHAEDRPEPRPYLFSFIGAALTHPVRRQAIALRHPRALLQDTGRRNAWNMTSDEEQTYNRVYAETITASQFVLCPRGRGPSSYRLFESMEMGRAPIIISDEWVPIPGPAWPACSLRVPERAVTEIPAMLERIEGDAAAMGRAARAEWEKWFARKVTFRRLVDQCAALLQERRLPERWARWPAFLQLLRPVHLTKLARYFRRRTSVDRTAA